MTLAEIVNKLMCAGPDRVVINKSGEAVNPEHARRIYHMLPDIIFIREDGWSLAAPSAFEKVAYAMWPDMWTHFMRKPAIEPLPIEQYIGKKKRKRRKKADDSRQTIHGKISASDSL